jgi:hypothetical protein
MRGVSVKLPLPGGRPEPRPDHRRRLQLRARPRLRCLFRAAAGPERTGCAGSSTSTASARGRHRARPACRAVRDRGLPGWGTPDDSQELSKYGQSCFHKWDASPYSLHADRHVPEAERAALEARFTAFHVQRPGRRRADARTGPGARVPRRVCRLVIPASTSARICRC